MTTSDFYDLFVVFLIAIPGMLFVIACTIVMCSAPISRLAIAMERIADAIEGKNSKDNDNKSESNEHEDDDLDQDEFPFLKS